jgi:soluble epoxide hydrolase/lipid-phosphate phosphatase
VKDYPHGQYDYQVYFERSYDEASKWFEKDPEGVLKAIYRNGSSVEVGKPGLTSTVTRDGGWFGGAPVPPIKLRDIPAESLCVDEELFEDIVTAMKKTGFRGANAWYLNHQRNCIYSSSRKVDGYLHMPVLFIGANWDPISDVAISSIANAQKHFCSNLQEVYLDAGHWVALEKPYEVNALIVKWLLQHVESEWPCRLDNQQHAS